MANKILLDTHVALWIFLDDARLPDIIRRKSKSADYIWIFHQVSLWEIQIKFDLNKLVLPKSPENLFRDVALDSDIYYEKISDEAIFMLGKLPRYHRDPFDRLLIAHAIVNNWQIATVDKQFEKYPVRLLQ